MEGILDRKYWFWLNNISGIGNVKCNSLLNIFLTPENIYKASEEELRHIKGITESDIATIISENTRYNIWKSYDQLGKKRIQFVTIEEDNYPVSLKQIIDAPKLLYYIGRIPDSISRSVAIVGSRNCTQYGLAQAAEIAEVMARNDINVISGMARGIDSSAHKGAIMGAGLTYAVCGCGVDICYPPSNINLYMDIIDNGGILSEYPPGTPAKPGLFPVRNRIISGLSDIVIVVEAREKSGSLITVDQALDQNRQIYAVPGRVTDTLSRGCNNLIKQGAGILTCPEDVFSDLDMNYVNICVKSEKNEESLESEEKMLYSLLLDFTPRSLDRLLTDSGLDSGSLNKGLISLEIKGIIKEISKNVYVRAF